MIKLVVVKLVVRADDPHIDVTVPDDVIAGDIADILRSNGWGHALLGITVDDITAAPAEVQA